jgi:hypothetical protein
LDEGEEPLEAANSRLRVHDYDDDDDEITHLLENGNGEYARAQDEAGCTAFGGLYFLSDLEIPRRTLTRPADVNGNNATDMTGTLHDKIHLTGGGVRWWIWSGTSSGHLSTLTTVYLIVIVRALQGCASRGKLGEARRGYKYTDHTDPQARTKRLAVEVEGNIRASKSTLLGDASFVCGSCTAEPCARLY